jgi:hypothetical protein
MADLRQVSEDLKACAYFGFAKQDPLAEPSETSR